MKVLILGGTSFFGKDMVRQFVEAGHSVTLFTRGNKTPTDLPRHAHIRGDRQVLDDLKRAELGGPWDIIVDNIAYDASAIEKAGLAFKPTKRYILCSTVSVYRYVQQGYPQPLKESAVDFTYRPQDEDLNDIHWHYAKGKLDAERVLREQGKLPWTILRPPVVYGPDDVTDRGFWYLERLIQGGPILLSHGGAASFRLVYSVDTARSFLLAAQKEVSLKRTYNIAQSEVITLKDFVVESAKALGIKPNLMSVPGEVLRDLGGPYCNMVNLVQNTEAAERDLGFTTTPFANFIAETAHWYRDLWSGDKNKLLETREAELQLARHWENAMRDFLLPAK